MGEFADLRNSSFEYLIDLLKSSLDNNDYSKEDIEKLLEMSKDELYSITLPAAYDEVLQNKWLDEAISIIHSNYLILQG
ncbi:MAG TPA: hypothetical protein PK079_01995 [Leptospiraceae bacterium]|nr:hypothetical protein [Leptospiraceae bacterium]HMW03488.1 hypothetical protein [Leptospiraceae bacterium]HMX34719.1 hypothetical protein [Leptospiraceae bacterium]HMY29592.1 hypothetical protein [Leptospiraceae bacterium]HMZ62918.1 hypothetical protein [Leptospiraceae bacterium]